MKSFFAVTAVFSLLVSLVACGGGGGGSSFTPITYTGNTAQATVDNTNAGDLAALAHTGSDIGTVAPIASATVSDTSDSIPTPVLQSLSELNRRLPGVFQGVQVGDSVAAVSATESIACGTGTPAEGTMSISATWNASSGVLSETVTFRSCDEGDVVFNGGLQATVSGLDVGADGYPDFDNTAVFTVSVTYRNLNMSFTNPAEEITVYGTVNMSVDQTTLDPVVIDMSMNLVMQESSGLTAKIENYHVVVKEFTSYDEIDIISARIYDHNYGYVDVSTPTIPLEENWSIYQGILRLDGADGTWAEVDFSVDTTVPQDNGTFGDHSGAGGAEVVLGTFTVLL